MAMALGLVGIAVWMARLRERPSPPSIVLITIDTLRPDRIGCYGHTRNRTPSIDGLCREGMVFEVAYCDMPWTSGSMSSVMTGYYSDRHGVQLPMHRLRPDAVTLAELLRARGYQTGAVVGSFPLDSVYGLDQGFETYDDEFNRPMFAETGRPVEHVASELPSEPLEMAAFVAKKLRNDAFRSDEDVTDAAIRWLDAVRDGRPFFLWVHYFGPHEKYRADRSFVAQEPEIIAAYDGDVEAADRAVGRFLDRLRALRLLDTTLVVLHADHGQSLGEHGYVGHGLSIRDEAVRIPLVLRYPPRIPAGLRRRDVARNVDLMPTILEVVGDRHGRDLVGRSLLPEKGDPEGVRVPGARQTAFFESDLPTLLLQPIVTRDLGVVLGPLSLAGVRTLQWRLLTSTVVGPCVVGEAPDRDGFGKWALRNPTELDEERCRAVRTLELYRETGGGHDVSAEHPDVVTELEAMLRARFERAAAPGRDFTLSAEQAEKLKSLGYLQ